MKNYLQIFAFLFLSSNVYAQAECSDDTGTCSAYPLVLRSDVGNWSITPLLHFATPSLKALQKVLEATNQMPAAKMAAYSAHMFKMMSTYYRHLEHNHSLENTTFVCDLVSDVTQFWSNYYLFRDPENMQGIDRARSSILRLGSTTSSEIKKQKNKETPYSVFSIEGVEYLRSLSLSVAEVVYIVSAYYKYLPGLDTVGIYKSANHMYEFAREAFRQQSLHLTRKMARGAALAMIYGLQVKYRPNPYLYGILMASEYLSDALFTYESK